MEGAKHAACTVEMASVVRQVDVAVVDEVQMVADPSRGHSFTRAILGIPAHTLHICGDPAALPLLRRLIEDTGEPRMRSPAAGNADGPMTVANCCSRYLPGRKEPDGMCQEDCMAAFLCSRQLA